MPDWMNVVWHTLLAITALFLMTRILGYRQINQLSYFQYITGITLGSLAAFVSLEIENWSFGVTSLLIWTAVTLGIEWVSLKSKKFRDLVVGKATVLIKDGKIMEDNLKKMRFTTDDLLEKLRSKGAFHMADVEFAVMETNGDVSVLFRKEHHPLTPKSLGIKASNEQEPQTVIMDGTMMDEALATSGYSRGWLNTELDKIGVSLSNVFLGQIDHYGQLTVDLYDDQIKLPEPKLKEQLWALLSKCEADLEAFALATDNKESKSMYATNAAALTQLKQQLQPYLKS